MAKPQASYRSAPSTPAQKAFMEGPTKTARPRLVNNKMGAPRAPKVGTGGTPKKSKLRLGAMKALRKMGY